MANQLPVYQTKWSSGREEHRIVVESPATGAPMAVVQGGGAAEVDACVRSLDAAFRAWRWTPQHERGRLLRQCARAVEAHIDEIAELETREEGKPFFIARNDTVRCVEAFDFFGGLIGNLPGDYYSSGNSAAAVLLEPYGVVAGIIPFNWPPIHTAAKAAPALAVGNTVALKPGDQAPLTILRIAELIQEVLPPGVLEVITGPGAEVGVSLTANPLVRKISFTGSSASGKAVLRQAAENVTPCMMELGGKNALIVMEGCDLDEILPSVYDGVFYNNGQACTASSRLLVHRSLYGEFVERFGRIVSRIRVGDGMDPDTLVGSLVTRAQQQRVLEYLAIGVAEGARIAAQAPLPTDPALKNGFFVPPTLFADVRPDMRIAREEIFGPVACVIPFDDADEAVRIANDSDYGLVGVVFSPDINLSNRVARELDVGTVYVNNFYRRGLTMLPFGGNKRSGYGRERSIDTLHEFGYLKTVKYLSGIGDATVTLPAGLED